MPVNPIPEGYPRVTPYLCCEPAAKAMEFYGAVFGATERMHLPGPDGKIAHCELQLGESIIMLADPFPGGSMAPSAGGPPSVQVTVYVTDCDATVELARSHGATITDEPSDQFYGDRTATFTDPFGHSWGLHTHTEDVSPEEMVKRMQAMGG